MDCIKGFQRWLYTNEDKNVATNNSCSEQEFDSHALNLELTHGMQTETGFLHPTVRKTIKIILYVLGSIIASALFLVVLYYGIHSVHTAFNHALNFLKDGHLSIVKSLMYVTLPIVGIAGLTKIVLFVKRKRSEYQQSHRNNIDDLGLPQNLQTFSQKIKNILKPTRKEVRVATFAIVILIILGIVGFCVLQCHGPHQWVQHTLNDKINATVSLAIGEASAVALMGISAITLYLLEKADKIGLSIY